MLMEGKPVSEAYKAATDYLDQANQNIDEICCCQHSHDKNCLFMRRVNEDFGGDIKQAHKKFH